MATVGYATLDVIPSMKGFSQNLQRQAGPQMAAAGKAGGAQFGDAAGASAAGGFKSKFAGAMKGFAPLAGLAAGIGAVDFLKDAVAGASDLSESANKINVVFGDAAQQVNDFAASAVDNLGQTELQARDAAATFGVFGKGAGLAGDELSGFSTKLVGLATDMASFSNTSVEEAIDALSAGLRGESDPLEKYGVLLGETTLKTAALKDGLIKTSKQALTPQQKTLAAYKAILDQTKDAQGDFTRTSGGLANQQRILSAQWESMKTEIGKKLLPVVTGFVSAINDTVLPALDDLGGLLVKGVEAFKEIPSPVKAAAAGFVLAKFSLGLFNSELRKTATTMAGTGAASLAGMISTLRLRAMFAGDAFAAARTQVRTFAGTTATVSSGVGRLSASMAAMRAGAVGLGGGLKRGLSGVMTMMGGPWGLAMIAGTVALTKFWQKQQEAKARVEALTDSLNQQTGAVTKGTKANVFDALQKSGAIEVANKFGIALTDVRAAAFGNEGALARVNAQIDAYVANQPKVVEGNSGAAQSFQNNLDAADKLRSAIGGQNDEVRKSIQGWRDSTEFLGRSTDATKGASSATETYADRIGKAKDAVVKLLNAENKRRLSLVQDKRDEIALIETAEAARKEARKGKQTLDENTKAGRKNWAALLDLADQWNQSTPKVQNARGSYAKMRETFINVADQMGKTREGAVKLADRLLKLPKKVPLKFQSEGYKERLAEIKELRREAALLRTPISLVYRSQGAKNRAQFQDLHSYATGGAIGGIGTGTSDSNLIWASRGEFMQRKAAVDYYGVEFMKKLNSLQVPKTSGYAGGGLIENTRASSATPGGWQINVGQVVAQDVNAMLNDLQRRAQRAGLDGVRSR